jgi:hypothetical protein
MSNSSTIVIRIRQSLDEMLRRHRRTNGSPTVKPRTPTVRCGFAFGVLMTLASNVSASEISRMLALPDMPFVIPIPQATIREVNLTTQLYNNARLGANLRETTLNPDNVQPTTFGMLHRGQVQGQVLAQPLFVSDVAIDGMGRKNLLIVATAANMVYALDANDLSPVFQKQLGPVPIAVDPINHNTIEIPVVCSETYPPYIGVSSTPVVDITTGTVFVESFNAGTLPQQDTAPQQELHALNLHDRFTSDRVVVIQPQGKIVDHWAIRHRNRAGLLLSQGVVYVAFSSFICDHPPRYAGWVMGYRASDLTQVAQWKTPPDDPDPTHSKEAGSSGIWQSGRGLVAAADGTIYFMTGNDSNFGPLNDSNFGPLKDHTTDVGFFPDPRLANSFVKLSPSESRVLTPAGSFGLTLAGSLSPKNSSQLSVGDTDLGSSGPILLPDNRLVGGGKQGRVYVLDATTMRSLQDDTRAGGDGFEGFQAFYNQFHPTVKLLATSLPTSRFESHSCTHEYDGGDPDNYCRQLHNEDLLAADKFGKNKCPYDMNMALDPVLPIQDSSVCYVPVVCYQYCQPYGPNIHAGFVYWQVSPTQGRLYAMPEKEHVRAFSYDLSTKAVSEKPVATSNGLIVPDGMPGGALSISANGNQNGIVWASLPNQGDAAGGIHRGSLVALDANDLHKLWRDDCVFWFAKFNPPVVANGRVYLATFADPVADRHEAVKPGPSKPDGTCEMQDPKPLADKDVHTLPVGFAWIIQYGLK